MSYRGKPSNVFDEEELKIFNEAMYGVFKAMYDASVIFAFLSKDVFDEFKAVVSLDLE